MCGLFGLIRPSGLLRDDVVLVEAIGAQLKHRGPDGSGFIDEPRALLGMHRLSIMDPVRGWQPFWSEDQRFGVLGNGEIYNASELRRLLEAKGHTIETGSDIEVIPHLLEEFGVEAFTRLRGMFALLIIDRLEAQVFAVRDRLGEKPLCYAETDGAILFASEQGALIRSGALSLAVDKAAMVPYLLHGYSPEPNSLIAGIRKIPAAHYMRISLTTGETSMERYWDSLDYLDDRDLTTSDLADALEDAVIAACTSDVPVGLALSGGLDSSLVAAIASKNRVDLHAFTIGYSEKISDESRLAAELASSLGIPCNVTTLDTSDIASKFAAVCADRDEPISDIAGPALAAIPEAARHAGVPVLLTGIGGDELFWGYEWIRNLAAWSTDYLQLDGKSRSILYPQFTRRPEALQSQVDWALSFGGFVSDFQLRRYSAQRNVDGLMPLAFYEFQPGYRKILRGITRLTSGEKILPEFWVRPSSEEMAAQYTRASNATYLRVNSFVQIDRLSMHHSIESRTPLADASLLETIMSSRLRNSDHMGLPKARLREVAARYLPPHVVDRPKRGFTPPVREWLSAIWKENSDALDGEACIEVAGLSAKETSKWISAPTDRLGRVNQLSLRIMTLELWLRSLA